MSSIALAFGQRLLPSTSGEQGLASSFAVVGSRHILCVADATGAPSPLALARAAVDAVMLRLRGPDESGLPARPLGGDARSTEAAPAVRTPRRLALPKGPDLRDLVEAMREAAGAVRRAGLGVAPGVEIALDLAVIAVDTQRGLAEVGLAGRLALFHAAWEAPPEARAAQVTLAPTEGPELATGVIRLEPHASLIVASRGVGPHVLAALRGARGRQDPHLMARQLAESARRSGEVGALFAGVLDRPDDGPREGPHPAFVRMQRDAVVTVDGDGHVLGARFRPKGAAARRLRAGDGLQAGRALAGLTAVCAVVVAGWQLVRSELPRSTAEIGLGAMVNVERVGALPPAPEIAKEATAPREPPALPDPALEDALGAATPALVAERIRDYVTDQPAEGREAAVARLEAAVTERLRAKTLSRAALDALPLLAADTSLPRTSRWASRVLARTRRPAADGR